MSGVKDRVALVTGAGSPEGIGFATARLLYSVGARVAITSTTDRINQRRDEIKGTSEDVFSQTADLTDSVAVNSLIEQIENELPYDKNTGGGSVSDFFLYKKTK